jgi:hypothetical protein
VAKGRRFPVDRPDEVKFLDVPKVSTMTDTGSATPMAYASCSSHFAASPAATMFFATYRAM